MQFLKPHTPPLALSAFAVVVMACASAPTHAQSTSTTESAVAVSGTDTNERAERVQVVVPYVELHLRPHRYFPVFFVVKRDEWLTIIDSQGDFLLIRGPNGQEGWVLREELESSLRAAGVGKSWRDQFLDDYVNKRLTLGAGIGRFSTESRGQVWAGYAIGDNLSLEGSLNQMYGRFAGAGMWQLDVVAFPWSRGEFAPYAGVGVGQLKDYSDHRASFVRKKDGTYISVPKATAYQLNLRAGLDYKLGQHYGVRVEGAYYAAVHVGHSAPTFDSLVTGGSDYPPSSDHRVGNFSSLMASFSYSF